MTEILKILSPVAILIFFWSIIQFFTKRRYEKNDKKREFKLKILTDFLTEINDIRVLSTEIYNQINKRTKKLNGVLSEYRNDVNQFIDKDVNSDELKLTFKNLSYEEKKEFIEKSIGYFKTENQTDADLINFLKKKTDELEGKALSLYKIPLLNLIASQELMEKRDKIIDAINNVVILDYAEESTDIGQFFHHRMQILLLSFEIEYFVLAEIKKI